MIKIFGLPWHCGHQAELFKLPDCSFDLLVNMRREWAFNARPLPANVKRVPFYRPGQYDLAILHVDQQSVHPPMGKHQIYKEMNEAVRDIPKIVINHGSPVWPEWYEKNILIKKMREMIGNNLMVVNSHKAAEEWGWGQPIIHGLDPGEWLDLKKEARIVTAVSPAGLDTYYNREMFKQTRDILAGWGIQIIEFRNDIVFNDFDAYRKYLGSSLIYFDYSLETPLNRARTEAMLSGCCVVTAAGHDTERFIRDGENAILVKNNPAHAAKVLADLIQDYEKCLAVGAAGKETAKEYFLKERYQHDWLNLINKVLKK